MKSHTAARPTPNALAPAATELPSGADACELPSDPVSRRRFLTLLGASAAFAAGSACSKGDRGGILPAARGTREAAPGVATHYASTFSEGLEAYPVLVKTREARPIHVQGNDLDPAAAGKAPLRAIADVLRLYDPDRLRDSLANGKPTPWDEVLARLIRGIDEARSAGRPIVLLSRALVSPTHHMLVADLRRALPTLEHVAWEPSVSDAEQAALKACCGRSVRLALHLAKARVLACFEADPLGSGAPAVAAGFAGGRRPTTSRDPMSRLWAVESGLSLTGAKADQRLTLRPSQAARLLFALARELHEQGMPLPAGVSPETLRPFELAAVASENHLPLRAVEDLVNDLGAAHQAALVVVGPALPQAAHVAGHLLNATLGADGYTRDIWPSPELATLRDVRSVLARMQAGQVGAVLFWDANPVYAFPDEGLAREAVEHTPVRAAIALHLDETAALCPLVFAEHHWLESWGDYAPSPAYLTLQQPALQPLFETCAAEDVLLHLLRRTGASVPSDYAEYVKQRWRREVHGGETLVPFERFWRTAIHDGVVQRASPSAPPALLRAEAVAEAVRAAVQGPGGSDFELLLVSGPLHDGRYSNNGWLQELPDPITKLTWGNVLTLASADAGRLGLEDGAVARLALGQTSVSVPVFTQAGQADGVATLALGHGRQAGGVATGIGVNAFRLSQDSGGPTLLRGATVASTGHSVVLASAQPHQSDEGRHHVRSRTRAELEVREPEPTLATLYPPAETGAHKWAMAVDLSACVGCSACVIACQSENNVPVVGAEQVARGRHMQWIRIDRYYEGLPENPRVLLQPMLCQHCDHAPCETVCPVNATTHNAEGLNQMTYNRCVGTRYCANNCPYKVRRFNFLDFTGWKKAPEILAFNPEVTVRPRGVMEKCSFCIQRIEQARVEAKIARRPMRDGDVTPACAAACPTNALVFGDLVDPKSRVVQLMREPRGYHLLAEEGVRPVVKYLAEIKNPMRGQTT